MKKGSIIAATLLAFGIGAAQGRAAEPTYPPANPGDPTAPPAEPIAPPPLTRAPPAEPTEPPVAAAPNLSELPAPAGNGAVTEPAPVAPLPTAPVYAAEAPPVTRASRVPVGVGLLVGGGFQDFSNGTLRSMTGGGGYWSARILAGTRQFVGLEAAYVGDARRISGLGLSNNSTLMSNGLESALRVNAPLRQGPTLLEPFLFGGLGWAHYQVSNDNAATSDVATSDDVLTLPFGGGLEFSYLGLMADARFTYRQTYYNNLLGPGGGNLSNWGVGGMVGFEY